MTVSKEQREEWLQRCDAHPGVHVLTAGEAFRLITALDEAERERDQQRAGWLKSNEFRTELCDELEKTRTLAKQLAEALSRSTSCEGLSTECHVCNALDAARAAGLLDGNEGG